MQVKAYEFDPGDDVLVAYGPALNLISAEPLTPASLGGLRVMGMVGAVVNDRGRVNEPFTSSPGEIFASYGGFKAWMGDELATAVRGAASAYAGNAAALLYGLKPASFVMVIPDLAVKDKTVTDATAVNVLLALKRTSTAAVTLAAGTQFKAAGGYTVATLEDLFWAEDDIATQTVRVRQVTPSTTPPVAMNTVTVYVETALDPLIVVDAVATVVTVPDALDIAEVILRYVNAFTVIGSTAIGKSINELCCDRNEGALQEAFSAAVTTLRGDGQLLRGYGGPPVATPATEAKGSVLGEDGVGRAALDDTHYCYVYPCVRRTFLIDADNLVAPSYVAYFLTAPLAAACATVIRPGESFAGPKALPVIKAYGASGIELLPGLVRKELRDAGITQAVIEFTGNGSQDVTYHDDILASLVQVSDHMFRDLVYEKIIIAARPYHKALGNTENIEGFQAGLSAELQTIIDGGLASEYLIGVVYDTQSRQLKTTVRVKSFDVLRVMSFYVAAGPTVVVGQEA